MSKKTKPTRSTQLFQVNLESIAPGTKVVHHTWQGCVPYIFRGLAEDERGVQVVQLQEMGIDGDQILDKSLSAVGATPSTYNSSWTDHWLESLAAFNHRQKNVKPEEQEILKIKT